MSELRSILIIDDSEDDRYLLRRNLQEVGLASEIQEIESGLEALDYLKNAASSNDKRRFPDLIFLDINMPYMNGIDFLEKFAHLRKHPWLRNTRVIMYSSSGLKEDRDRAIKYDFVIDYFVKSELSLDLMADKLSSLNLL